MSEPTLDPLSPVPNSVNSSARPDQPLFAARPAEPAATSVLPWTIAGLVILFVLGGILLATREKRATPSHAPQPLDPYASSLTLSGIVMSESTSLSGGKSTFIDGEIRNTGDRTVSAATVQVLFANDEQLPPQVETLPLTLIRTHQPYIDTEPVSASPIRPGEEREFRLIFENIGANWNQQLPAIRVIRVQ